MFLTKRELEIIQIGAVTPFSLVVYSSRYPQNIFNDFIFCVLTQYYAMTHPERIVDLYACLASSIDYSGFRRPRLSSKTNAVCHLRYLGSVMISISIYAVDFCIFNRKFRKSHSFGISLMDIGVGFFAYSFGVVRHKKKPWEHTKKSCKIFIILGITRYVVVRIFGLTIDPREYGFHLNFYFIMAFISCICYLIRSKYDFFVGLCIISCYDMLLRSTGLSSYILSEQRHNIIDKNKEGIAAVVSYISIFLMSTSMGRACSLYQPRKRVLRSFTMTFSSWVLYAMFYSLTLPSRRAGNASFVFLILFLNNMFITLYLFLEYFLKIHVTDIERFCSFNMVSVFLLSNLLILLGNLSFDLMKLSRPMAHIHMISYLAMVFLIPTMLSTKFNFNAIRLK